MSIRLEINRIQRIGILFVLVCQTSANVLLMRYSRLYTTYSAPLAIFCSEIIKYIICLGIFLKQNEWSVFRTWRGLKDEVLLKPRETIKLVVPALLYTVQNNVLFIALTNLDAATFQITYQLKILTTSVISVLYLGTKLNRQQWSALMLLTMGVVTVQLSYHEKDFHRNFLEGVVVKELQDYAITEKPPLIRINGPVFGLICVLFACFSSAFSGIYFEKLMKSGSQCSLVIRNIQLGIFSILFGGIAVFQEKGLAMFSMDKALFNNFDTVVWIIVILQGFGGIVIAAVIKYTDNIQKGFATSISIVVSCIFSFLILNDLIIDFGFIIGTFLVVISTISYAWPGTNSTKVVSQGKCVSNA